jgi:hypothetical protein
MTDSQQLEAWLNEYGVSWERGKNPGVWWVSLGSDKRIFRCAVELNPEWVSLLFRFSDTPLPPLANLALYLLDLNDQLSIFKFFCDEWDRIYIGMHWPVEFLTLETLGYLVHEMGSNVDFFYDHIQEFLETGGSEPSGSG